MRILMVEDDVRFAKLTAEFLSDAGYLVEHAFSINDCNDLIDVYDYNLYLVDLDFPDGNGVQVIKKLRSNKNMAPILVLTGRAALNDTVKSLDCGADDFVTKPVHPDELLARVRAVLRRQPNVTSETLEAGNLVLDTISGEVMCFGSRVSLMKSEQRLLAILMRRAGYIVPKSTLEDALTKLGGESTPNAIEKTVSRLRKSISRVPAGVQIKTAVGIGYSLELIAY